MLKDSTFFVENEFNVPIALSAFRDNEIVLRKGVLLITANQIPKGFGNV